MDRQANASRTAAFLPPGEPEYMKPLLAMNVAGVPVRRGDAARGLGDLPPVFDLPEGFHLRLGRNASDNFVTGTYRAGGRNIGYIRIPRMSSTSSLSQALRELELEIAFLEQHTDGLVVDIMRNPGGLLYYGHELARRFIPTPFEGVGFEVRASATYVTDFSNELERARGLGAPDHVVRTWAALLHDVFETYKQNRGRTGILPLDGHESLSLTPAVTVYTKPLILLVDEYSCSTADLFAAVLQDAGRGPLAGMRTAGCGGSYGSDQFVPATVYSEGKTGVTEAIMVRPKPVVTPEFPTTRYIENVGVRPDVEIDVMTRENLLTGGKPFVDAFTQVLLDRIGRQ
jgi:C-terminal processing protease CtpA/Prc